MDILFVTLSSIETNTSAMLRNKALIKGLIQNGAKIDLLTIPALKIHPFYDDSTNIFDGMNKNVNVILLNQNSMYSSMIKSNDNFLGKIKKKILPSIRYIYHSLSLFDNTIYLARKIKKSLLPNKYYDIIISSSDPKSSHIAAHQLIKLGIKYGKWIQYWGDPMTNDITNKSLHPKWYIARKEYSLLKNADDIVYVSPFTLELQKSLFPSIANKMYFIPIPYIKQKNFPEQKNKKFTIGYYGAYKSKVRNIMPLYKSCIKLGDQIHLDIIGDSDLSLSETKNINIYPRGDISSYEEKVDLLVCMLNSSGTQIPGKIYHYAATNKPILIILDGDKKEEIRKYLDSFDRYIMCDNNVNSITTIITEIMSSNDEYEPCKNFEPETIAQRFINLVN